TGECCNDLVAKPVTGQIELRIPFALRPRPIDFKLPQGRTQRDVVLPVACPLSIKEPVEDPLQDVGMKTRAAAELKRPSDTVVTAGGISNLTGKVDSVNTKRQSIQSQ